jgi:hypothetical protein
MDLARENHPTEDGQSDSEDQYRGASDRPPSSGFRARFQRLRIAAQYLVAEFRAFQGRGFVSGIYPAYFRNEEPISSLWNCLNVSGIVSVIVQRLPKLANCHPETAVKIYKRVSGPETASKFLSSDHLSGVFQKRDEQPAGLLLQLDASPILQELP